MSSQRLHVLGFPHTQTTPKYATCAYTQRVVKFCRMMHERGREVILYSGEENEAPCDEHVVVVTNKQQRGWFGKHDENDLDRGGFKGQEAWQPMAPWWSAFNAACVGAIRERMDATDLLCLSQGWSQKTVVDSIPEMIGAEIMVGYRGIIDYPRLSPVFAAFESQSHRAMVYGEKGWNDFPREADVVIPNSFDPDELPFGDGGDYLLFVGRIVERKGLEYAAKIANELGMKLVVAGPGGKKDGPFLHGEGGSWQIDRLKYVGAVGVKRRARLMGGAAALLAPTLYAEPFGGVAVEAMMCGTPVVTTDFGAFTDTVKQGVSGYRFQTLQEAIDATVAAMQLDRRGVRSWAIENFSLDAVRPMYERWFANLDLLWCERGNGFQTLREKELVD